MLKETHIALSASGIGNWGGLNYQECYYREVSSEKVERLSMDQKFDIVQMASKLKLRKQTQGTTALFLGAKAGGLFRSFQLYKLLSSVGPSDLYSLLPVERYRRCYNILCDTRFSLQDIHDILTDKVLMQEIRAEVPELCIAELVKQGFFNPILSVSMYGEFEEAFQQMGMKGMLDFAVVSPKSGASMPRIRTEKRYLFTLIKVFGDIESREYNVNRRVKHLEESQALKEILHDLRDANILMVGVDQVWDQYIVPALLSCSDSDADSGRVWYVNDEEPAKNTLLSDYLKLCKAEHILGVDGHYENFFRSLCWHITGAVPTYQAVLEALEKVNRELRENQNAIRKLADEIGDLREGIGGLQSELRPFLVSPSARSHTRKANTTSKIVEEK